MTRELHSTPGLRSVTYRTSTARREERGALGAVRTPRESSTQNSERSKDSRPRVWPCVLCSQLAKWFDNRASRIPADVDLNYPSIFRRAAKCAASRTFSCDCEAQRRCAKSRWWREVDLARLLVWHSAGRGLLSGSASGLAEAPERRRRLQKSDC